jgi:hypothetical protein
MPLLFQKELLKYMSKLCLRLKLNPLLLGLSSLALVTVCNISKADAAAITFTGSANSLGALATFDNRGTNLIVTLTNTSSADVLFPQDVLTTVFFNLSGDPILGRVSALIAPGSREIHGLPVPTGGIVGGEWRYDPNVNIASLPTVNQSLSALGVYHPRFNFPGPLLRPGGGVDWGLVGPGDNPATGSTQITYRTGLIRNSVVFTLSGLPIDFNPATDVSNIFFQYGDYQTNFRMAGTPNSPPNSQNVPEPSTIAGLLTISLAVLRFCGKSKLNN